MNRRKFLTVAGGGVILAAGAATGWVATRTPSKALAPWEEAGSAYDEPRRKALSYAILAPNPHNRQPWMVDLSKPDTVILKVDTDRMLPHTDPLNRQITVGLGCFLELMKIAANEDGYRADITAFPDGFDSKGLDSRPVAVAKFVKDEAVKRDPLFAHVMQRRSVKEPFDQNRPVSQSDLDWIGATAKWTAIDASADAVSVEKLRMLTHDALVIELETPRTYKESVDLFRIGKAEIEANPDGIDFSGPMFEALGIVGMMTRDNALDRNSEGYKQGVAAVLENTDTAMAHLWQVTNGNTRISQINAGRDWLRLNLAATAVGLSMQPLSQALQEYAEMKPLYDKIHTMLAPDGGTIQMLGRLGYANPVPVSPRWPLEAKIVES
ncbi:MAG: Acg family FMN-binding oxidoreductase [Rhizobiaceae bacterium]